jgi:Glycosyltransferase family 87
MLEAWKSRAWQVADGLALLAVIGWLGYAALGTNVFGKKPWPDAVVDYRLLYEYSRQIVEQQTYPEKHAYPPPAILFHYATAQLSFPVSAGLYLAVTIAAAFACWWILLRMLRLNGRPGSFVLVLVALTASSSSFSWDLKSQNCNVIFLLAVLVGANFLASGRALGAGFWLAFSFSLKLFSVLLIPYLLWRGDRRALLWTMAFMAMLWVVLPACVFGWTGAIEVYGSWLEQMNAVSTSHVDASHPVLISLLNSADWLSGHDVQATSLIVNSFRIVWLVVCLAGLIASRLRIDVPGDAFGLLADISVLILAPIAVSPYLEPYHTVPFAIPALLLLHAATDIRQHTGLRLLAVLLFASIVVLSALPAPWEIRGLTVNLKLLVGTGGVVAVAWLRRPREVIQKRRFFFAGSSSAVAQPAA